MRFQIYLRLVPILYTLLIIINMPELSNDGQPKTSFESLDVGTEIFLPIEDLTPTQEDSGQRQFVHRVWVYSQDGDPYIIVGHNNYYFAKENGIPCVKCLKVDHPNINDEKFI